MGSDAAADVPAGTSEPCARREGDSLDFVASSMAVVGDSWDEPAPPFEVAGEAWEYSVGSTADDAAAGTLRVERDRAREWGERQADALVAMAETVVGDGLRPGSGPGRYQVVIHLNTTADSATPIAWIDDGPVLDADTARRLMCDASQSFALHGPDGIVTNVSAKAPTVPRALSRAVKLRDDGCVFPGCTRRGHVDLHHLRHRARGGENSLANLACLCRAHHRMVHEGGYGITRPAAALFEFCRPDGTPITNPASLVPVGDEILRRANTDAGVNPGAESQTPDWDGSRPNYAMIIENLLYVDGRLDIGL